ncbi:ribosomal protein L28e [Thozetella sp. PMI_491]|nr:ribosomal protein L28e [Thozetella sp. PMI_491]
MASSNVSADLVWEVVRPWNSFLVKRRSNGGVQFSRDPYNLTNKHSRKYAGFVNDKAIGLTAGEKGGVQLISKKTGSAGKPSAEQAKVSIGSGKSNRKTFKAVAGHTARQGYRADLRAAAVSRASAIRQSQRPVKETPEKKLRGTAAKRAEK